MRWLWFALLAACSSTESSPSSDVDSAVAETFAVDSDTVDTFVEDTTTILDSADSMPVETAADGCPVVTPAPDVDAWAMRPKSAGFGGITEAMTGTHKDVFLDSPTKYIRIGARLNWGGTVVFFGLAANPKSNVIDANDTGRELQLAIYDPTRIRQGCAVTASCATSIGTCAASITYLGWNPVQGGDECNRGAPVLSHGKVGDALELVIQPLQWNPDWDAPDCRTSACTGSGRPVDVNYRMRLRFVREHVVEVDTEVTSKETISHPSTAQEFPTLYVANGAGGNPDLPLLLDSAGTAATIATPANDGFFVGNFTSPGPWVTWQNTTKDYGVALSMDQGTTAYQGWRGDGSKAPYFHNVRAQIEFALNAGATVRGISYLALGGYSTVKTELEAAMKARGPFGHIDAVKDGKITGWVLDNRPGVKVTVDGVPATMTARPDVCLTYPAYPECAKAGFELAVTPSSCPRLIKVVATDSDGNEQILGERAL
jgi:hypothetical protein